MLTQDPVKIKHLGDSVHPEGWSDDADVYMREAVLAKFSQNENLKQYLLATGSKRIAEATSDRIWGCGKQLKNTDVLTIAKWRGAKNLMGRILESVRGELA